MLGPCLLESNTFETLFNVLLAKQICFLHSRIVVILPSLLKWVLQKDLTPLTCSNISLQSLFTVQGDIYTIIFWRQQRIGAENFCKCSFEIIVVRIECHAGMRICKGALVSQAKSTWPYAIRGWGVRVLLLMVSK